MSRLLTDTTHFFATLEDFWAFQAQEDDEPRPQDDPAWVTYNPRPRQLATPPETSDPDEPVPPVGPDPQQLPLFPDVHDQDVRRFVKQVEEYLYSVFCQHDENIVYDYGYPSDDLIHDYIDSCVDALWEEDDPSSSHYFSEYVRRNLYELWRTYLEDNSLSLGDLWNSGQGDRTIDRFLRGEVRDRFSRVYTVDDFALWLYNEGVVTLEGLIDSGVLPQSDVESHYLDPQKPRVPISHSYEEAPVLIRAIRKTAEYADVKNLESWLDSIGIRDIDINTWDPITDDEGFQNFLSDYHSSNSDYESYFKSQVQEECREGAYESASESHEQAINDALSDAGIDVDLDEMEDICSVTDGFSQAFGLAQSLSEVLSNPKLQEMIRDVTNKYRDLKEAYPYLPDDLLSSEGYTYQGEVVPYKQGAEFLRTLRYEVQSAGGSVPFRNIKKKYPWIENLPFKTAIVDGSNVTTASIDRYLDSDSDVEYGISYGRWSGVQRTLPGTQKVVRIDLTPQMTQGLSVGSQTLLDDVMRRGTVSGHPVKPQRSIGWARVTPLKDEKAWFIDEIQSDVLRVMDDVEDQVETAYVFDSYSDEDMVDVLSSTKHGMDLVSRVAEGKEGARVSLRSDIFDSPEQFKDYLKSLRGEPDETETYKTHIDDVPVVTVTPSPYGKIRQNLATGVSKLEPVRAEDIDSWVKRMSKLQMGKKKQSAFDRFLSPVLQKSLSKTPWTKIRQELDPIFSNWSQAVIQATAEAARRDGVKTLYMSTADTLRLSRPGFMPKSTVVRQYYDKLPKQTGFELGELSFTPNNSSMEQTHNVWKKRIASSITLVASLFGSYGFAAYLVDPDSLDESLIW